MTEELAHTQEAPSIHATIARIGTLLSSARSYDAQGATAMSNPTSAPALRFGPEMHNQFRNDLADLFGVLRAARKELFGTFSRTRVDGVKYAPERDLKKQSGIDDRYKDAESVTFPVTSMEISHPFWDRYEPTVRPREDWQLLTGHLQHLYTELVTAVLAGAEYRATLLKMVAMHPAINTVSDAMPGDKGGTTPFITNKPYLVMQSWSRDQGTSLKQVREFLKTYAPVTCTVSIDQTQEDHFKIKPKGQDAILVSRQNYLAVDQVDGNIVELSSYEFYAMTT